MPDLWTPIHLTVQLRFQRGDAKVLQRHMDRVVSGSIDDDQRGFLNQCIDAAAKGEPVMLSCASQSEAEKIADDFTRFGIRRPVVGS